MDIRFTNNAASTLYSGMTAGATTLDLVSAADFPEAGSGTYFYITIVNQAGAREIIKCEARTAGSNTLSSLTRGVDGSTAQPWAAGDKVQVRVPSIVLQDIIDAFEAADTVLEAADTALDVRVTALEDHLEAPAGTRLFFHSDTPPTGWTTDATIADQLLAIKGGSNAYNVSGGTKNKGSWTPTDHIHTMDTHVHTMGTHKHTMGTHKHTMGTHDHIATNHSHTVDNHNHQWYNYISGSNDQSYDSLGSPLAYSTDNKSTVGIWSPGSNDKSQITQDLYTSNESPETSFESTVTSSDNAGDTSTENLGDTSTENPGDTDPKDPGDTNPNASPSTDRPYAAVGIIASKD